MHVAERTRHGTVRQSDLQDAISDLDPGRQMLVGCPPSRLGTSSVASF